ncbi:Unknown protein [Striga hermonthica]|uniref:Uncharacterized protein n=1 Tax=Striga hermonthica TaxID=68872 RepID=A0A9N7RT64_STRHE|nr:Unknown protein [Striga hermonthica]
MSYFLYTNSFISIKFEDNGVVSWDKASKMPKIPHWQQSEMLSKSNGNEAKKVKSGVEHEKPRAVLRWWRRIGHIFQLIRLRKPTKGNVCHVSTKPTRN